MSDKNQNNQYFWNDCKSIIDCRAINCQNCLINARDKSNIDWGCNLKRVTIDDNGKCEDFTPMKE